MNQANLKLHLGCGEKYLEGYVNIDFPETEHPLMNVKADLYQDIRTLDYPENSIAEIRNHHVFEHFSRAAALKILLLWRKMLKVGGILHIETPDFELCARKFLLANFQDRLRLGRHIMGSQEAKWAYHFDFWYAQKFRFVLAELGFEEIKIKIFRNVLAQRINFFRPILNFIGDILPNAFYEKFGGHKLPNIEVWAKKSASEINEKEAVKKILSQYLIGLEGEQLLNVWLKEAE